MAEFHKLERRMGLGAEGGLCIIMMNAGQRLALDTDRCMQILTDSGYRLPRPIAPVHFDDIPDGLSGAELERHLREYARRLTQPANRVERAELARSSW